MGSTTDASAGATACCPKITRTIEEELESEQALRRRTKAGGDAPTSPRASAAEPSEDTAAQTPRDVEGRREFRRRWTMEREQEDRQRRAREYQSLLEETRRHVRRSFLVGGSRLPANRYGDDVRMPPYDPERHVPVLALINPRSGAQAGADIMSIAHASPYFQDRFFSIVDVVRDQRRGGLLDVFRIELTKAKDEAKARGLRPRVISGGGDGTGSFALGIVFAALTAHDDRAEDGLRDTGNGFVWTDQEMEESFPALAQMPLGTGNDFAHTCGWGKRYPGHYDLEHSCAGERARGRALQTLHRWMQAVMDPASKMTNFDVYGFMPLEGQPACNFKLAELAGRRGFDPRTFVDGEPKLVMKEAGSPVPLFLCLYFSAGFAPYAISRFQVNRWRNTFHNRLEYARQFVMSFVQPVPMLGHGLENVKVFCGSEMYFPPRAKSGNKGGHYHEVGFTNVNWQAGGMLRVADRAPIWRRMCCCFRRREPAKFNDSKMDMYRSTYLTPLKNPGFQMQSDKREAAKGGMTLKFEGGRGKGIFFQWDGEARFCFSPTGEPFDIHIRKIVNVPMVLGPEYSAKESGDPDNGSTVRFAFFGATPEEREAARVRVIRSVRGELEGELNAKAEEMRAVGLVCQ